MPAAEFNLGFMFHMGLGVAADVHEAIAWYNKAARANYAQAIFNLGLLYNRGAPGVPVDDAKVSVDARVSKRKLPRELRRVLTRTPSYTGDAVLAARVRGPPHG